MSIYSPICSAVCLLSVRCLWLEVMLRAELPECVKNEDLSAHLWGALASTPCFITSFSQNCASCRKVHIFTGSIQANLREDFYPWVGFWIILQAFWAILFVPPPVWLYKLKLPWHLHFLPGPSTESPSSDLSHTKPHEWTIGPSLGAHDHSKACSWNAQQGFLGLRTFKQLRKIPELPRGF